MRSFSLVTFFLLLSNHCFSTSIFSTQSGEWSSTTTWGGLTPSTEDTVIISSNQIVSLTNSIVNYNGVLIINGILSFDYSNGLLGFSRIGMDSGSIVIISSSGSIISSSNNFLGDANGIRIGFNLIAYSPEIDGTPLVGPASITDTGGVLPIELILFSVKLSGSVVEIDWATATELNNDFFTIERSINGIEWSIIGELEGAGDSHVRLDYQFIDYNPMPGLSYYRLKQTDFDGQFEYFDPAVLLYEPDNLFKVFPNPVQDILNLTTTSNLEDASIFIKSLNGQREQVLTTVNSHQAEVDMTGLPTGVYVLEIVFPESTLTKRILKK